MTFQLAIAAMRSGKKTYRPGAPQTVLAIVDDKWPIVNICQVLPDETTKAWETQDIAAEFGASDWEVMG
jgi:hypothetical protein